MTFAAILVVDRERDQLVAVEVEGEAVCPTRAPQVPSVAVMCAGVAHAGRDQRGKAAARGGDAPLM